MPGPPGSAAGPAPESAGFRAGPDARAPRQRGRARSGVGRLLLRHSAWGGRPRGTGGRRGSTGGGPRGWGLGPHRRMADRFRNLSTSAVIGRLGVTVAGEPLAAATGAVGHAAAGVVLAALHGPAVTAAVG